LATLVAIPEEDTVTRDSFVAVLGAMLADLNFDALADDVAAVSSTPTDVEPTADFDDVDIDGIA
jgi:hypothetical protein